MFGIDDAAAASLIGTAASVGTAAASGVASSKLNKKTMKFNREEAEKQRLWNEKMFNAQNAWNYERWQDINEYNSPLNQVNRLREAGLNPLYYGLDGSSAGDVSSAQPLGYDRASLSGLTNPISSGVSAFADSYLLQAQKRNLNSQSELNGVKAAETIQNTAKSKFDLDLAKDLRENTLAQSQANLDKTIQETSLAKANEILSQVDAEYRRVGKQLTLSQIELNDKQKEKWDAEIKRLGFQNWESLSQIEKNKADANLANETARQVCYSIENVMPAMVADYCASAGLKTAQEWNARETSRFQEYYNDNVMQYLPQELQANIAKMNRETKIMAQQNVRDWIKLPAEFVRDAGIGVGACAKLFAPAPAAMAKIGF